MAGSVSNGRPSITSEQAQRIIAKNNPDIKQSRVAMMTEVVNRGYSYTPSLKTYLLDLAAPDSDNTASPPSSCFLTISTPDAGSGNYHPNFLPIVYQILSRIRTQTGIPIPESVLDITLTDIPYHYLLSPVTLIGSKDIIPLSRARKEGLINLNDNLLIDLQLGKFLGQLHSGVQNDWYGLPNLAEPMDASYSWQETFTSFLEELLVRFETVGYDLPYEDIRRSLSRAIGFFLFDDVEVPSLVWFTGGEDDIYVALPIESRYLSIKTPTIAAILPSVSHALWGDPLLESFFLPPAPSAALQEGYNGGGGGPLIVFPRQETKRAWYTLFLALVTLTNHGLTPREDDEHPESAEKRIWCRETILKCVEILKDGPCY
ncbi:hypothetical protein BDQ12DRAFT_653432 [Crucibulum laeve]|uniref:Aminoglycoside phosphotransferase domain-containing protein n=1 Tax=Crucibulum laeve TaxID=68775 RepID=A0A5C3LVI6_9AGAR|nr:hypothetical protein BDQ12DRAFT_653432 [Crucibulum laeve]